MGKVQLNIHPTNGTLTKATPRTRSNDLFGVLEALAQEDNLTPSDAARVAAWLSDLEAHSVNRDLSCLEHLTLLQMERVHFRHPQVTPLLAKSIEQLTGKSWLPHQAVPLLPRAVLRRESHEFRVLYEGVYYAPVRREPLLAPLPRGKALDTLRMRLTGSAFWNRETGLAILGASAACLHPLGRQVVLGAIVGFMGASISEYLAHLGVVHATGHWLATFKKAGMLGRFAEEVQLFHKVHHYKMLTDFRTDFSDALTQHRVENYLEQQVRHLVTTRVDTGITPQERQESEIARILRSARAGGYGVHGTPKGGVMINFVGIPMYALNIALYSAFGGLLFLATSCLFLCGFIVQSMYAHRYFHMTREDVARSTEKGETTPWMRAFIRTSAGQRQMRRHYRHHHESFEYSRTVNGGIMSFSWADFVFRRGVHEAELRHLLKMRREGFLA